MFIEALVLKQLLLIVADFKAAITEGVFQTRVDSRCEQPSLAAVHV